MMVYTILSMFPWFYLFGGFYVEWLQHQQRIWTYHWSMGCITRLNGMRGI